ncbi:hypothetical protein AB5I41_27680 [Sphingomonas sp. MMS24-JH45]
MRAALMAGAVACVASPTFAQEQAAPSTLLHLDRPGPTIAPEIYGQFAEHLGRGIYEGIWVGEKSSIPNTRGIRNDVVKALREVKVPAVRWPGCFADRYHWRDGIGRRAKRPRGINAAWGDEPDLNAFGTHEYFDFLGQIGAQAFVSVNVASGSVREAENQRMRATSTAPLEPLGAERAANGHRTPWKRALRRHRQRELGLRRQHDRGNLCRAIPPVSDEHPQAFPAQRDSSGSRFIRRPSSLLDRKAMAWCHYAAPQPYPARLCRIPQPASVGLSLHFYTFTGNDSVCARPQRRLYPGRLGQGAGAGEPDRRDRHAPRRD